MVNSADSSGNTPLRCGEARGYDKLVALLVPCDGPPTLTHFLDKIST